MKAKTLTTISLATLLSAGGAGAAVLVNPSGVVFAGTAAEFFSNETRLIDASGLSGTPTIDNYVSITHGAADANNAWVTTDPNGAGDFYAVGGTVVFNFALDQQYGLTDLVFWGYHFGSANGNEGRQFRLEMSTDGGTNFGAPITVEQPLGTYAVQNPATVSLAGTYNANFVRMTVLDNHFGGPAPGGDRVGLAEVRFVAVPEASTLLLGGLGMLGLLRRRRG